jgi:hypothetical protein
MPKFRDLSTELQAKVKTLEMIAEKEGKDEAKVHEYYRDLKKSTVICGALTTSNKICTNKPYYKEDGTTNGRCIIHGGKSTGAKTKEGREKAIANLRGRSPVHGLYTKDFLSTLTDDEIAFMQWLEEGVRAYYEVSTPLEETALQMLITEAMKHFRIVNTRFEKESKYTSEPLTKFLRIIETQGWRRKEDDKTKGVSADVMLKLINELDEPRKSSNEPPKIKRIK